MTSAQSDSEHGGDLRKRRPAEAARQSRHGSGCRKASSGAAWKRGQSRVHLCFVFVLVWFNQSTSAVVFSFGAFLPCSQQRIAEMPRDLMVQDTKSIFCSMFY